MPLPISLAHKLAKRLTEVRKNGTLSYLRPDGKTQVTVEYINGVPKRVDTIVVSSQHSEDVSHEKGENVTKDGINAAMKAAASDSYGYNEDQIVSTDVIGITYGSLFDATQTMVSKIDDTTYQVQVVSWYDNENSYTSQMVRTIKYFAELN